MEFEFDFEYTFGKQPVEVYCIAKRFEEVDEDGPRAWWEAEIVRITPGPDCFDNCDDGCEGCDEDDLQAEADEQMDSQLHELEIYYS